MAERMVRTLAKEGLDDADALARAQFEGGAARRGLAKRILQASIARLERFETSCHEQTDAIVNGKLRVERRTADLKL